MINPTMQLTSESVRAAINEKLPKVPAMCGFCGRPSAKRFMALKWMGVQDNLANPVDLSASDGVIPCAIFSCGSCGFLSFLDLVTLGIVTILPKAEKPNLRLIDGGKEERG